MVYKQDPKSFWRRGIYLAKHSLTSDAWYLVFMSSLEECRLWSLGFHLEHHHQEESRLLSQLKPSEYKYHSHRTTPQCCRPNTKSRSRFSFPIGHRQKPHRISTNSGRQITIDSFICTWISKSEVMIMPSNTWILAALASERKAVIAVLCFMKDYASLIESAGKGRGLGHGGDVGSQMKSFIRWLLNYSAVPSTAQGCQLVSLQNQN